MPRADGCQATADRQGRVKGASDALGMWSRCAHFKAGAHHMGGVNITSSFGRTELQVQIPVTPAALVKYALAHGLISI
ncbi:hypothetical protein D3C76_82670 [compost metagenome]